MSFDSFGKDIASTLAGVFGDAVTFMRPHEHSSEITAVIRRDVETVDENGQVALVQFAVRFAVQDVPFTPKRGDTVTEDGVTYELGRRLSDNQFSLEFEARRVK